MNKKNEFRLGLGCWPIGGKMFALDGTNLGYSNSDDKESIKAIEAAVANGIYLFDTAAAYGAGHSERLLAQALGNRNDVCVVTKIGIGIDEENKILTGEELERNTVLPAVDRCLQRLGRETIHCVMLHPNDVPDEAAEEVFDELEKARGQGKIESFGWSTDYVDNVKKTKAKDGFQAVEHAMHVLLHAPDMQSLIHENGLTALIRSPLAMGLLSGKYSVESEMPKNDIRSTPQDWTQYYVNGKPNPDYINVFDSVRELLQVGGRTTTQGALGWLWAKSLNNVPLPGARTAQQVEGLAKALSFGPIPHSVMNEIDTLVGNRFVSDGKSPK